MSKQPPGRAHTAWGLFNWGNPWGTFRTRKDAKEEAERICGEPWSEIKQYCSISKCKVTPL